MQIVVYYDDGIECHSLAFVDNDKWAQSHIMTFDNGTMWRFPIFPLQHYQTQRLFYVTSNRYITNIHTHTPIILALKCAKRYKVRQYVSYSYSETSFHNFESDIWLLEAKVFLLKLTNMIIQISLTTGLNSFSVNI